jgi:hypothetical protein
MRAAIKVTGLRTLRMGNSQTIPAAWVVRAATSKAPSFGTIKAAAMADCLELWSWGHFDCIEMD